MIFSICNKHSSLTKKILKQRKKVLLDRLQKFGNIDLVAKKQNYSEANPIKLFFFANKEFFRFFCSKLGYLITTDFYKYSKHWSLTAKNQKKSFIGLAAKVCGLSLKRTEYGMFGRLSNIFGVFNKFKIFLNTNAIMIQFSYL